MMEPLLALILILMLLLARVLLSVVEVGLGPLLLLAGRGGVVGVGGSASVGCVGVGVGVAAPRGLGSFERTPEMLVHLLLLRIAVHDGLVSMRDLLVLLLGSRRLVLVRVVLQRQLAEGLLDLLLGGSSPEPEYAVRVLLAGRQHDQNQEKKEFHLDI